MTRNELFRIIILSGISDDYEELDMIRREAGEAARECGLTITGSEVAQVLLDLISLDLARAYRLSSTHPVEEIQGAPSPSEMEECYFLATSTGRELQSNYPDWPSPPADFS